ncbi:radical SAM protein [Deferribacter abyssi]|uniref:radical SAM protein n=1 Tax=Deferribacter abyssi TaxID=213806 RepID=UPI003C19E3C2
MLLNNLDFLPKYSYPLYRPPSEANSLIFQVTEGCSYNQCSFCGMYVTKKFKLKSFEDFKAEVDIIPDYVRNSVKRIFLADGDAVIYPTEGLIKILDYININFPNLERISSYAGPQAILSKGMDEWTHILKRKLNLLYFGLESANNDVLEIMNKGMDAEEVKSKVIKLQEIGFTFSIMVILGGGGVKFSEAHALDTAKWISEVNPKYLGMLTLFIRRKKNYFEKIEKPMIRHLIKEARMMIEHINGRGIIFRSNHVSNMFILKGILSEDRESLLNYLDDVYLYLASKKMLDTYPDYYKEEF